MRQQKGKIVLVYFFLFLIVGSINNNSLNRIQLEKIKNSSFTEEKYNSSMNIMYKYEFDRKILEQIEEQVNTCCAVTMYPEDVLELIVKLRDILEKHRGYSSDG